MRRISFRNLLCGALAIVLGALSGISIAADTGQRQVVNGVAISLGVLPAEMVFGQPKGHHEADMHQGAPGWGEQYHVMVSLFDHQNWMPITGAEVRASVSDARTPGQRAPGPRKQLGPMAIAGGMADGNRWRHGLWQLFQHAGNRAIPNRSGNTPPRHAAGDSGRF